MSIDHLSDEDLQSYVDGQQLKNKAAVECHLQSCNHCRRQLTAYRLVNEEFHVEPGKAFSNDFENVVIQKIHEIKRRRFRLKNYLLLSFSMVVCIGMMAYGFLSSQYRTVIKLTLQDSWISLKELLHDLIQGSEWLTGSFEIILFAGIILFIFGFLDKILFYPKRRKMTLFHCI